MRFTSCLLTIGWVAGAVPAAAASQGVPIKHVIVIMQENRSFDSYFGTFPGADGIPTGTCVRIDPVGSFEGLRGSISRCA